MDVTVRAANSPLVERAFALRDGTAWREKMTCCLRDARLRDLTGRHDTQRWRVGQLGDVLLVWRGRCGGGVRDPRPTCGICWHPGILASSAIFSMFQRGEDANGVGVCILALVGVLGMRKRKWEKTQMGKTQMGHSLFPRA